MIMVYYKTVFGTNECIGALELSLQMIMNRTMPNWYRLYKKGKINDDQKYRGEIMLKFEFLNQTKQSTNAMHKLSVSTISMNSFQGLLFFFLIFKKKFFNTIL